MSITESQRRRIYAQGTWMCAICGKSIIAWRDLTIDHITPKARGGSDDDANLQLAHRRCNCKKQDLLPGEERRHSLPIRVTRIERMQLREAADAAGQSMSEYVRDRALN